MQSFPLILSVTATPFKYYVTVTSNITTTESAYKFLNRTTQNLVATSLQLAIVRMLS